MEHTTGGRWRATRVAIIDGGPMGPYPAEVDTTKQGNGFELPRFDPDTAKRIVRDYDITMVEWPGPGPDERRRLAATLEHIGLVASWLRFPDEDGRCHIGSGSWAWREIADNPYAPALDASRRYRINATSVPAACDRVEFFLQGKSPEPGADLNVELQFNPAAFLAEAMSYFDECAAHDAEQTRAGRHGAAAHDALTLALWLWERDEDTELENPSRARVHTDAKAARAWLDRQAASHARRAASHMRSAASYGA